MSVTWSFAGIVVACWRCRPRAVAARRALRLRVLFVRVVERSHFGVPARPCIRRVWDDSHLPRSRAVPTCIEKERTMARRTVDLDLSALQPVLPSTGKRHGDASRLVRYVMRPMTRVFNPILRRAAGRRFFSMAAQVGHRGRHSGLFYITPVSARPLGDGLVIPLTFGDRSDWCRNVLAAGSCSIRFKGRDYYATAPIVLTRTDAQPMIRQAFRRPERLMFLMVGIKRFLYLRAIPAPGEVTDVGRGRTAAER
jgi:hypothetical protein